MQKLSERIYTLPFDETTDRPVLGYIRGQKYSLMIDAGNSRQHVQLFLSELDRLGLPHPDTVAITHWHWDHSYGLCGLDACSLASQATNDELKKMTTWEWTDAAMQKRLESGEDIAFCDEHIRLEYPDRSAIDVRTAHIVFKDRLSLDLGDISCHLIKLANSHSSDSIVALIPEEKVIFLGDICGEDLHHGQPRHYPHKLKKLITSLKVLEYDTAIHGHEDAQSKDALMEYLESELNILVSLDKGNQ